MFIIGGQALNLWAERYAHVRELASFGPYTSKDLDYFGHRDAAEKLARHLGGRLRIPEPGNVTPQSAILVARVAGREVEIDFLAHVLGVRPKALEASAVEIIVPVRSGDEQGALALPVMHPLHCFQSRVANVIQLRRKDDVSRRQLGAAPIVIREYTSEMLALGEKDEATRTLQRLFEYLRSDINGRVAHRYMDSDPAGVIDHFATDERIDVRYRQHNILAMQEALRRKKGTP